MPDLRARCRVSAIRRAHLKQYITSCLQDSVLTPADLMSPAVFDKLLKVLSADTKAVLGDLGRAAGGSFMKALGESLMGIAQDVVAGRPKR